MTRPTPSTAQIPTPAEIESQVIEIIKQIYDPEIPVNIYDLGLIYDVTVTEDRDVFVKMTLTAPNCPVAGSLPISVRENIQNGLQHVRQVDVEIVWEPQWNKDMITETGLLQLGLL